MLQNRIINSKNPILLSLSNHVKLYPTPVNFSYAYSFGSLVGIFFAIQILTGIFLAMHYTAHTSYAFSALVHIMADVKNGYLLRYMHANGASMIFILIFIHIGRGLYYRSYIYNRRQLWWSGIIIFLLMIITAFIGYVLPWGQMSFWGATVITSLVTAVPFVGESIAYWIWGGFSLSNATLIRFFSLHYLLPFVITALVFVHLILLHEVTSTNPTQLESPDKMSFHPYFIVKDLFALTVALLFFLTLVHFYPNVLGHSDNFIPANPLVTPPHIVPEWYFTPFYAILRSCPNKLGGVIFMLAAILIFFIISFYKMPVNSVVAPLSSLHKIAFWFFSAVFLILLFLGGKPATAPYVVASQFFTFAYFTHFFFLIPVLPIIEKMLILEYKNKYLSSFNLTGGNNSSLIENAPKKKLQIWTVKSTNNDFSFNSLVYFSFPVSLVSWVSLTHFVNLLHLVRGVCFNFPVHLFISAINLQNSPNSPKPPKLSFLEQLQTFINIWSFQQWFFSLITLILFYWFTTYVYNWWLSEKGGWLTTKNRILLILVDLGLNLGLGLYYMSYRETIMGSIMMRCPIAVSPVIFILELVAVFLYSKYGNRQFNFVTWVKKTKKDIFKKLKKKL